MLTLNLQSGESIILRRLVQTPRTKDLLLGMEYNGALRTIRFRYIAEGARVFNLQYGFGVWGDTPAEDYTYITEIRLEFPTFTEADELRLVDQMREAFTHIKKVKFLIEYDRMMEEVKDVCEQH